MKGKVKRGTPLKGKDKLVHWRSFKGRHYPYNPQSTAMLYTPDCGPRSSTMHMAAIHDGEFTDVTCLACVIIRINSGET
jgi:hypothetical protein